MQQNRGPKIPEQPKKGRPRVSSRLVIEDAAAELFVENTYAGTTIEHITQRAGVSRATFFNYFTAKSDLLWYEVDRAIDELRSECERAVGDATGAGGIRQSGVLESGVLESVLLSAATRFDDRRVPLALTQYEVMGSPEEIVQSGLSRVAELAAIVTEVIARRDGGSRMRAATAGNAIAGAVAAAWVAWARAGVGRGPLEDYVVEAIAIVAGGVETR